MKKLLFVLSIVAMLSLLAAPALAAGDMTCDHGGTTMDPIESLHHCVDARLRYGTYHQQGCSQ